MTRSEFWEKLKENNINENVVSFEPDLKDGYCVRRVSYRWEVFVRERGQEYESIGFRSESEALEYLFDELSRIYKAINKQLKQ